MSEVDGKRFFEVGEIVGVFQVTFVRIVWKDEAVPEVQERIGDAIKRALVAFGVTAEGDFLVDEPQVGQSFQRTSKRR